MAEDKEDIAEVSGISDSQLSAEVAAREIEVNKLLDKKDKTGALVAALYNPPVGAKSADIKERNGAIVEKVLAAVTEKEIPGLIDALDSESLDNLMKYVFKFMSKSSNCSLMLKLHESVTDKAGLGCIVRVLTDRKQV